jgi:hypothetical protein
MYFNNTINQSKVLAEPIKWGEYTSDAGSNVAYRNKLEIFELVYECAFLRPPDPRQNGPCSHHFASSGPGPRSASPSCALRRCSPVASHRCV